MKNQAFRLKMAKQKAEALLREIGMLELPVDPTAIAEKYDIVVQAKPDSQPGVSGMLLRNGNEFGILYATHIRSEGFQRFSVAHELGHYFLEGHVDHVLATNGVHVSHAGFVSADPYEMEADQFAAGLLMPSDLFKRALNKHACGVPSIEALAALCRTSLTATAIRYAELCDAATAVILSTGSQIDYCGLSDTMKSLKQLTWLRNGSPVPSKTATSAFNSKPNRVANAERVEIEIDILDWLGGIRSLQATETVIGLGSYGRTLTVLTCPSLVDETYQEEDDDSDEGLEERWTPRFRK
jgi:Zn-dependent peptidase ImmA (M78 family)